MTSSSITPPSFEISIPPESDGKYLDQTSLEQVTKWEEELNLTDREVLERAVQYKLNKVGEKQ